MEQCDVLVVGLGIMGAAVSWCASELGATVQAIERDGPTHCSGSSHGATRIFRQAYWEGERYLPMLAMANAGWRDLERGSNTRLVVPTGGLFIGPRSSVVIAGSRKTAAAGEIPHQQLCARDLRARFPQFSIDGNMEAIFEPGAYTLLADQARLQMLNRAVACGAQLSYGDGVASMVSRGGRVSITTRKGRTLVARAVIVCAGPRAAQLLPELRPWLSPRRVPIHWFLPLPGCESRFGHAACPAFLYQMHDGTLLYGIPAGASTETGIKIGFHNLHLVPSAPEAQPPSMQLYVEEISGHVAAIFRELNPLPVRSEWCFYTMTPDESFILGESTRHRNVFYASACSGHGFKFAPAVGQLLAELATGASPSADISPFSADRFSPSLPPEV